MEKRVSDFNDEAWKECKRPKETNNKRNVGNCRRVRLKKVKKPDRLDDMRLIFNFCIMALKFFVLLNVLVITSKML
ncbi:hypothetical protein [Finegoldia magna]|uniref:hypothetical protein n=1 Tax=Finegoldia magna TaxID=1260 RepID=UPI002803FBF8|nr:hypothetical protein [Finegoldia magna]MDU5071099.1 hypothetical protein [Finegoldia magna]